MPYEPPENDAVDFTLESYSQPANDAVDFDLEEDAEPEPEEEDRGVFRLDSEPLSLPLGLDLPVQPLNLRDMNTGFAVFLVGLLTFTGGASAILRNYAAMGVLGLAVVALLMSGTLGIGLEAFWALTILCVLTLIAGAVMRVGRS